MKCVDCGHEIVYRREEEIMYCQGCSKIIVFEEDVYKK